ncbi:dolichyl-P-Man:Man(5)GlcNAc(2)-PP-dolichol alpha-1,3-mannosyltransferase [Coemansia sp. RSA 2320]|nr:dolichyl-P-Man:Man(5)GlcNAc(2)-PP-dolichol alpha-1,3-mannosyltransferase [Coemansia sp. RSA 2320]
MPSAAIAPPRDAPLAARIRVLVRDVLFTPQYFTHIAALLIAFEAVLNYAIIQRIGYTEIDWRAYMQEVEGVIAGERNYLRLKGDTGPLVYPAGFVWVYEALWYVTDGGSNIRRAQYVFMGIYLATLAVVLAIYRHARLSPVALALLVLSKRLHSIYVLRLFNDSVAMLPAYLAIYAMLPSAGRSAMRWSGLLLSLGIAVKMNVQLMLPGAAYIWWRAGSVSTVCAQLAVVAGSQTLITAPFLSTYPTEYVARAFDFGRQFDFTWTVNWRFVGSQVFLSQKWAEFLLVAHLGLLLALGLYAWPRLAGLSAWAVVRDGFRTCQQRKSNRPDTNEVLAVMFSANFVGIVCARSLHYQFYSWYFHMLPFLLHKSRLPAVVQLATWLVVEYAWNVYPSTSLSSILLLSAHLLLLAKLVHSFVMADTPLPRLAKRKTL